MDVWPKTKLNWFPLTLTLILTLKHKYVFGKKKTSFFEPDTKQKQLEKTLRFYQQLEKLLFHCNHKKFSQRLTRYKNDVISYVKL